MSTQNPAPKKRNTLPQGVTPLTAEGHLYDARDQLLAHATTTCLVFPV